MKNLFKHIKLSSKKILMLFFVITLCFNLNINNALSQTTESNAPKTDLEVATEALSGTSLGWNLANKTLKATKDVCLNYYLFLPFSMKLTCKALGFEEAKCTQPSILKEKYLSNNCIFCPFFSIVYNMVSKVAKTSFNAIAPHAVAIVGVAMALWLANTVIQFIATIDKRDPKDLFQGILVQSFKVFLAITLLKTTSSVVFSLLLEPILITGLKIPGILFDANCGEAFNNIRETLVDYNEKGEIIKVHKGAILSGGGLPPAMGAYINCIIWQIEQELMNTVVVGSTIMCIGWEYKHMFSIVGIEFFPHVGVILMGLTIFIWALIFLIGFPFYMIDTTVKLGIGAALIPLAIAGWPFKMTKDYATKVLEIFLECMFSFIALACIMYVNLKMIETALNGASNDGLEVNNGLVMSALINDPNYIKSFIKVFNWSGIAFLNLLFILVLCQTMISELNQFAKKFVDGPGGTGQIGGAVGGQFAKFTKGAGNKLWTPINNKGKELGSKARKNLSNRFSREKSNRSLNKSLDNVSRSGNLLSTNNKFGGTTHEKKDKKGNTVNVQTSLSGNILETKTTKGWRGESTKEVKDKFLNVKTRTDKDGNILRQEISFIHNNMLNKDGTINTTLFNNMLKDSMHDPKMLKQAMTQQIMKQQFGINNDEFDFGASKFEEKTNKSGQTVLSLNKIVGGKKVSYDVTFGNDGRVMCEETKHNSNGTISVRKTDGILERSYKTQKDGTIDEDTHKFGFSDKIKNKPSRPVDSLGNFHRDVPIAETMFGKDEIDKNMKTLYEQSQK